MPDVMQSSGSGPSRLQRFALQMPMRYRYAGAYQWYRGVTQNVSCSGMLFRGPVSLEAMSPVEVRMALPRQMTGEAAATMLCGGYIARVLEPASVEESQLAATFTTYRLLTTNGHRRAEVNLSEKATEAARDDLLDQFVHEFRNMLEIIIGHADLVLMRSDLDQSLRTSMIRIRDAGERAATLTRALAG